ncbi:hypothetical protein [Loktanella sp. SALINAS62]|uniref:hypothetical protein n=1 Tax=Loktanella sp. SALINAS62 TaxID=2706124 RepID=UPI001B8BB07F|nr:hypothetical protein [Loktanella sp. SALINAS62]
MSFITPAGPRIAINPRLPSRGGLLTAPGLLAGTLLLKALDVIRNLAVLTTSNNDKTSLHQQQGYERHSVRG